jgi:hypothetical protein
MAAASANADTKMDNPRPSRFICQPDSSFALCWRAMRYMEVAR